MDISGSLPREARFTLRWEHVALLRRANVTWSSTECGAPRIDPKRPFGNSDLLMDIARILGWKLFEDGCGEKHLSKEQHAEAVLLHRETETALQVMLAIGSFGLGEYERGLLRSDFELVKGHESDA